jgi:molybdenum cofactor biosynthesis enzyme
MLANRHTNQLSINKLNKTSIIHSQLPWGQRLRIAKLLTTLASKSWEQINLKPNAILLGKFEIQLKQKQMNIQVQINLKLKIK